MKNRHYLSDPARFAVGNLVRAIRCSPFQLIEIGQDFLQLICPVPSCYYVGCARLGVFRSECEQFTGIAQAADLQFRNECEIKGFEIPGIECPGLHEFYHNGHTKSRPVPRSLFALLTGFGASLTKGCPLFCCTIFVFLLISGVPVLCKAARFSRDPPHLVSITGISVTPVVTSTPCRGSGRSGASCSFCRRRPLRS